MTDFGKIIQREDGSFVITKNGMPYHVPNIEGFEEEFKAVSEYAKENPTMVQDEPKPEPPTKEELAEQVRVERDRKLTETDKYLIADYPISESSLMLIKEYRRKLRDITKQSGFPTDVVWPDKPEI